MKRALPNSQRQVRLCLTKEGARLKSNAPGMDVFYQLPEDIRLKFFDNKRLVYISLRLPEEEEKKKEIKWKWTLTRKESSITKRGMNDIKLTIFSGIGMK